MTRVEYAKFLEGSLNRPFMSENSQAFQMGLVDGDGKQLRKANTTQEKEAYTFLNRFVFKIQNALMRSSDRNARRLLSFAAALALLREYKEEDDNVEEEIIDDWELYEDDDFDLEEAAHKAFYSENL